MCIRDSRYSSWDSPLLKTWLSRVIRTGRWWRRAVKSPVAETILSCVVLTAWRVQCLFLSVFHLHGPKGPMHAYPRGWLDKLHNEPKERVINACSADRKGTMVRCMFFRFAAMAIFSFSPFVPGSVNKSYVTVDSGLTQARAALDDVLAGTPSFSTLRADV